MCFVQNKIHKNVAYPSGKKHTTLVYCSMEYKDRNYSFECVDVHFLLMSTAEKFLNDPLSKETEPFTQTFLRFCIPTSLREFRQSVSETGISVRCDSRITLTLRVGTKGNRVHSTDTSKGYCPLISIIRRLPKLLQVQIIKNVE
jgi:hypothetical protein